MRGAAGVMLITILMSSGLTYLLLQGDGVGVSLPASLEPDLSFQTQPTEPREIIPLTGQPLASEELASWENELTARETKLDAEAQRLETLAALLVLEEEQLKLDQAGVEEASKELENEQSLLEADRVIAEQRQKELDIEAVRLELIADLLHEQVSVVGGLQAQIQHMESEIVLWQWAALVLGCLLTTVLSILIYFLLRIRGQAHGQCLDLRKLADYPSCSPKIGFQLS